MPLISKKARYALHGMGYIARHSDGAPVPFQHILRYLQAYSKRLTLSPSYIAKVFQAVSRAGLMEAVPGPRGGYELARPPAEIRLIEIVEALDGPLRSACCLLSVGGCDQQDSCGVGGVIRDAERAFYDYFEGETLASMAARMAFPEANTSVPLRRR